MASDINTVTIIGRITRDAELRYTGSGTALCNFSIASNRRIKKVDQWIDEASFFDLTLFNKQAEGLNKYLTKGTQVAIQGALKQDRWEKDGQKHSKISIAVDTIQLIGGKREGEGQGSAPPTSQPTHQQGQGDDFDPSVYEDDPIPF